MKNGIVFIIVTLTVDYEFYHMPHLWVIPVSAIVAMKTNRSRMEKHPRDGRAGITNLPIRKRMLVGQRKTTKRIRDIQIISIDADSKIIIEYATTSTK